MRTKPDERPVAPAPTEPRSMMATRTPRRARWKARLAPWTPAPTTMTSAVSCMRAFWTAAPPLCSHGDHRARGRGPATLGALAAVPLRDVDPSRRRLPDRGCPRPGRAADRLRRPGADQRPDPDTAAAGSQLGHRGHLRGRPAHRAGDAGRGHGRDDRLPLRRLAGIRCRHGPGRRRAARGGLGGERGRVHGARLRRRWRLHPRGGRRDVRRGGRHAPHLRAGR